MIFVLKRRFWLSTTKLEKYIKKKDFLNFAFKRVILLNGKNN